MIDSMLESGTIKEGDIKKDWSYKRIFQMLLIWFVGNLPDDFKEALREAFVSFENEEYFEALQPVSKTRFVEVEQDYYDSSIKMLEAINALEEE